MQADSAPLGLGYLAAYVLRELPDTQVKIIDYGIETYTPEKWHRELASFQPDMVGFSVLTLGYQQCMRMAKLVKACNPAIVVIAGGPHATVCPEECLTDCDIVVRGEGEQTLVEILREHALESINGISYRQGDKVMHNPPGERIDNLDNLPMPAHHLFKASAYKQYPGWGIIGSRGCTYNCIFCASPKLWGRVIKLRSPQSIIDEIEYLYRKLDVKHIVFQDDAINLSRSRALAICDEIIQRGLHQKMSFECQVRANRKCVSSALFSKMQSAGFNDLTFGIETGSDRVMKSLRKSLTVDEAKHAVRLARRAGIRTVTGFFMVGNWGESLLDVLKTWWFVVCNKIDMKLTVCTPLPGTEFERLLAKHGYLTGNVDWQNVNWVTPLSRTDRLSRRSISLLYYLTVLLVHLPSSYLRGRKEKSRDLVSNIISFAGNRMKTRGKTVLPEISPKYFIW